MSFSGTLEARQYKFNVRSQRVENGLKLLRVPNLLGILEQVIPEGRCVVDDLAMVASEGRAEQGFERA